MEKVEPAIGPMSQSESYTKFYTCYYYFFNLWFVWFQTLKVNKIMRIKIKIRNFKSEWLIQRLKLQ